MRRTRLLLSFAVLFLAPSSFPARAGAQEPAPSAAAAYDVTGAVRLGLTGSIVSFGRTRYTGDGGFSDVEETESHRSFGTGVDTAGLELGYGLGSRGLLGLRAGYDFGSDSFEGERTKTARLALAATGTVIAASGGVRPYGRFGFGLARARFEVTGDGDGVRGQRTGPLVELGTGLHGFVHRHVSLVGDLGLEWTRSVDGGIAQSDVAVSLAFGVSAWLGGRTHASAAEAVSDGAPTPDDRVRPVPAPVVAARPTAPSRVRALPNGMYRLTLPLSLGEAQILSAALEEPTILRVRLDFDARLPRIAGCTEASLVGGETTTSLPVTPRTARNLPANLRRITFDATPEQLATWARAQAPRLELCGASMRLVDDHREALAEFLEVHLRRAAEAAPAATPADVPPVEDTPAADVPAPDDVPEAR